MSYVEAKIPDAPAALSLLERTAYELLKSRLEEDDDPGEAVEQATGEEIGMWLIEQARSLGGVFRMAADHFQPDMFQRNLP
jgi:hypothetical protein